MNQPSRDDIARLDKVHARADQAIKQIEEGHIITECTVLFSNETEAGEDITWKGDELARWPMERAEMIDGIARRSRATLALADCQQDVMYFRAHPEADDICIDDMLRFKRGHVMYRQSAAFVAAHPIKDPYVTNGDKQGAADRG